MNGNASTNLFLRGRGPTLDVIITDSSGATIWQRLKQEIVPAIVNVRILKPHEQFELEATWVQRDNSGRRALPGKYFVRGLLLGEDRPLESQSMQLIVSA